MRAKRQQSRLELSAFTARHPVFSTNDLATFLGGPARKEAARERVKYHAARGRLKAVSRGIYAAVPPGLDPERFQPDRYLVATSIRPDAMLSHHSALELLGAAHTDWNSCTALTGRRRAPLRLGDVTFLFVLPPRQFAAKRARDLGVRGLERMGVPVRLTGPERTLLDGLRQPRLAGGLAELVESASGFGVLDLDLLAALLEVYDQRMLWAAAGWFLERYQDKFFVDDRFLAKLESRRPRSAHYLPRGSRKGGSLLARWNLVLPSELARTGEPGEPE
jgi:predicted transcriptional regulator of viral defense system